MTGPIKIKGGYAFICSSEEIGNWAKMAKQEQEDRYTEEHVLDRQHETAVDILSNEKIGE